MLRPADPRWRLPVGALAAAALALTTGCSAPSAGGAALETGAATATDGSTAASTPGTRIAAPEPFRALRTLPATSAPERLRIPAIGVDAPVGPLGVQEDGAVEVPQAWESVGWYSHGARPGDSGPAVLLGHVDSKSGPAVFFRLSQLERGSEVEVVGEDGRPVRFTVDRLARYAKTGFPTDEVYLPTLRPELRLVTCGGRFDSSTGHYVDNLVVYASLAT